MDVDAALTKLGKYGRWQIGSFILISIYYNLPCAWHMYAITFIGDTVPHWCQDGSKDDTCQITNTTNGNTTIKCDKWYYNTTEGTSIVSQWDLVCDSDWYPRMTQMVFVGGVMVGAMICSPAADRVGRKTIHLLCQGLMVIVGVTTAFSVNYVMFIILRFFAGVLEQGMVLSAYVQATELFPAETRTYAGLMTITPWAIGMMTLPMFSYYFTTWWHLQLLISLVPIIFLSGIWILPESIPWLVANEREEDAEILVKKAAKINKVHMPDSIFLTTKRSSVTTNDAKRNDAKYIRRCLTGLKKLSVNDNNKDTSHKKENIMTIIRHKKLRCYALVMCVMWFSSCMGYYSVTLGVSSLAGSKHLNFFLLGLLELPLCALVSIWLARSGRRIPMALIQVIAGIAFLITGGVPNRNGFDDPLSVLNFVCTLIGFFCITMTFGSVFLYAGELYPTNVRNTGLGISSVSGRIGGMIAPFVSYLGNKYPWFPGIFLGSISVCVGFLTLYLPETLGRPLPQTIEDMEDWDRKVRKDSTTDDVKPDIQEIKL